ncbi:hypothetical protein G7Y89_g5941 [Cudoniella acicularis]|uniref:Uncharacterized protein n=1 Tax=Cudoniella acicularis TaxID=354080 RepID=A0A8H4RNV1_9HELO|nr:hypothetical protein G7Y89_g5941 [Cudoniella acicularis]
MRFTPLILAAGLAVSVASARPGFLPNGEQRVMKVSQDQSISGTSRAVAATMAELSEEQKEEMRAMMADHVKYVEEMISEENMAKMIKKLEPAAEQLRSEQHCKRLDEELHNWLNVDVASALLRIAGLF